MVFKGYEIVTKHRLTEAEDADGQVNCWIGAHVKREGWHNWNKTDAEQTVQYVEYNSFGPGAGKATTRVSWAKVLSEQEAAEYALPLILSGEDGWQPFGERGINRH
ncbi:hypothetical protein BK124_26775 [Paenibacillus amylolyticus]|uniref:pectinesterase family protein n=1 Tax=Paenibacillus TaxID=44249 RepID=UPI0004BC54DB|nr:pectinesterase family protein [Paenibacillus amylolyticus]OME92486.1 hypothetical protein BK124_26775 [Paenibacillus amylolyticus]